MTRVQVVYWRDIPAHVKARQGGQRVARPLSDRFQQAIDVAAMRAGLTGTDDYLAEWRTLEGEEQQGDPEALAQTMAEELEVSYPSARLAALVDQGGRETSRGAE